MKKRKWIIPVAIVAAGFWACGDDNNTASTECTTEQCLVDKYGEFNADSANAANPGFAKHPDQSFNTYTTKHLDLRREPGRSDRTVKDVILVGNQKMVIWNPPMGKLSHSFKSAKDGRSSADTLFVHAGDNIGLDITVSKTGDKIWLQKVFIGATPRFMDASSTLGSICIRKALALRTV